MTSSPLAAFTARTDFRATGPRQFTIEDVPKRLEQLSKAALTRNAYPKETLEQIAEQVSSYANEHGLPHEHLENLLHLLTTSKSYLDSSKIRVLVKSLVPQTKIKSSLVVHLIGRLGEGQGKAAYATQALLLRWLVMVYDFLESYTVLHQLYGLLFNFLYTANLRPHACHLLALCTRRKDVKPFRIQALMKLYEDHSAESGVVGLLQVFQSFYPDVILRGTRKRSVFKTWDPIWLQNASLILSRREGSPEGDSGPGLTHRRSNRIIAKSRKGIVPTLHTFDALETSITLEEIDNVKALVDNLQKLELPSQIGAVYLDDMFRNFVLLKGSEDIVSRLDGWTSAALFEELDLEQASGLSSERLEVFLNQILDYAAMRKGLLPSVNDFLKEYLVSWKGVHHKQAILGLLSFFQFSTISELKAECFSKLERLFLGKSLNDALDLIRFHIEYLRNLIIQYSAIENVEREGDIRKAIRDYVNYVDKLNLQILVSLESDAEVIRSLHTILGFYECAVLIPLDRPVFEIIYPADAIIYTSVFSGDAVAFSSVCGVLAKYKQLFIEHTELRARDPRIAKYGEPDRIYVDHFNGFLMDISNFFWRFRSFSRDPAKDTNALGCLMREDLFNHLNSAANARELSLNGIFTITHSATFSRFNSECMRFLQDQYEELKKELVIRHAGPITSKSLAGLAGDGGYQIEYRVFKMASLEYLRRKGFDGVHALIYSTMKKLREEAGKYNVETMFEGLDEWAEMEIDSGAY